MIFIELAACVFLVSCIVCTIIIVAGKWHLIEFYEVHIKGRKIFRYRLGEVCYFCLSFWLSVVIVAVLFCCIKISYFYFVVPFASASLTIFIIENIAAKRR
jgi:hypothetical protein